MLFDILLGVIIGIILSVFVTGTTPDKVDIDSVLHTDSDFQSQHNHGHKTHHCIHNKISSLLDQYVYKTNVNYPPIPEDSSLEVIDDPNDPFDKTIKFANPFHLHSDPSEDSVLHTIHDHSHSHNDDDTHDTNQNPINNNNNRRVEYIIHY